MSNEYLFFFILHDIFSTYVVNPFPIKGQFFIVPNCTLFQSMIMQQASVIVIA